MDALVERSYGQVIDHCQVTIEHVELSALPKLALLFRSYYASSVEHLLDHYLHGISKCLQPSAVLGFSADQADSHRHFDYRARDRRGEFLPPPSLRKLLKLS